MNYRIFYSFLFFFVWLPTLSQAKPTARFDWDGDGQIDFFFLDTEESEDSSPDEFVRVRLEFSGRPEQTLLGDIFGTEVRLPKNQKNLANSKHIAILQMSPDKKVLPFVFIESARVSNTIYVFRLDLQKNPKLILKEDDIWIQDIVDLDKDGMKEIVGKGYMEAGAPEPYKPSRVFKLSSNGDLGMYVYDKKLSKEYNLKNNSPWLDEGSGENFIVVMKGKKRVLKKASDP